MDMLATPLPGLKVFARDAVLRSGHMVELHALTDLYVFVIFIAPAFGMAFGKVTLALFGCRP